MLFVTTKLLSLPSVEKRDNIPQFLYPRFSKRHDDTYIAYLCFKRSLIVCVALVALNWLSYTIGVSSNFGIFKIDLPRENFAEAFMYSFPRYASAVLLFAILPFHLVLLRTHINPKTYDLLWWNVLYAVRERRTKKDILWRTISALMLIPFAMFNAFGLPYFYMDATNSAESLRFFATLSLLFPVFLSWMNGWMVITIAVVRRYGGNYEGD